VDDDGDNIYMLSRRLKQEGFDVIVAMTGTQGVTMAASARPDLILMDMNLPKVDGWEATRRLKAAPETTGIPVIGLSAHGSAGAQERALAAGCVDYETKPVAFQRLLQKIKAAIAGEPPS
jgi:CheY-like chemotaxis protein